LKISLIFFIFISLFLVSCSQKEYRYDQSNTLIDTQGLGSKSTTAGNLMASAIQLENDLDIVLYPNTLLKTDYVNILDQENIDLISSLEKQYPEGEKDQFVIGFMKGSDLTNFIYQRTIESYSLELEVAGMSYEIIHKGGMIVSQSYQINDNPINMDQFYKIAISKHFIFSNETFPSYKYRNSIDRVFIDTNKVISARKSLRNFIMKNTPHPFWNRIRAQVKESRLKEAGQLKISQIQGPTHISPFIGYSVITQGIVTAFSELDYYPGGYVAYIQSETSDNDNRTSEALKLYFDKNNNPKLKLGDLISVKGSVFEEENHIANGLTTTSLRDIKSINIMSINNRLPKAIRVGKDNKLAKKYLSTYQGDLNQKKSLNLKDGLDFWEAHEGMRISLTNPRIVGFRGGKEQSDDEKSHLTLFVIPNGDKKSGLDSKKGGILADTDNHIFNPHIIPIASSPMTVGLKINEDYAIGDIIDGQLTGLVSFTKNLFGDAEYIMVLPTPQESLDNYYQKHSQRIQTPIEKRPKVEQIKDNRNISIAAYNVKNLSPVNKDRIKTTASMIKTNLNCPDILGLVEIQDNNGEDFNGGSEADSTLNQLIKNIPCSFQYKEANIDPLLHREGGVPGANIRVSLIYNSSKLNFRPNPLPDAITDTNINSSGDLNYNPGRVGANTVAFRNTRKSLIAQFELNNEDYYIIVNHFNSKLSDTSHFSSIWPMNYPSEVKRSLMAKEVNSFVRRIEHYNPAAKIAVIGDFNEFMNQAPMKVLEGSELFNLMRKIPKSERYTTNHNGNSQPLDYIFVNKNLLKNLIMFKPLHLNSDYMGRLSDHDPVYSIFNQN